MPKHLAPGVYVEEVPTKAKPIEGVGTSTAGFVGAAQSGPLDSPVGPITSLVEFEQQFGDGSDLAYPGSPAMPAFLWHATRSFFVDGGKRLWVVRVSRRGTGGEGARPRSRDFERGLAMLDAIDDVAMIAAPGATFGGAGDFQRDASAIAASLLAHAERMRYRIALLDAPNAQTSDQVRAWRAGFASSYAALYFPWVSVADPKGGQLVLPPSGFVAGIFASNDTDLGVQVSPAGRALSGALGVEVAIDDAQAALLDAEGIGCIRWFADRGVRVWNARMLSSDPDWQYVNLRRLFIYLEDSIDRGLQWAVFEPNGAALWENVRRTVSDFLFNEWQHGTLSEKTAPDAFFVRCDCNTMTRDDIDNGRVVVLVGVAPAKPAEFVIFRVTVQTAAKR